MCPSKHQGRGRLLDLCTQSTQSILVCGWICCHLPFWPSVLCLHSVVWHVRFLLLPASWISWLHNLWVHDKNAHKNSLFAYSEFSTLFFSRKMAESEKNVLVNCIIDFDNIQVWLRRYCLNLNACKDVKAFLRFSGQILKKTIITFLAMRFKLNSRNHVVEIENAAY